MPLVQTRGAASAQGFGEFAQAATAINYIEDVFSPYLYTGTGASQTITNGIDLSGKGGLVWVKMRNSINFNMLYDTARGVNNYIFSDGSDDQNALGVYTDQLTAFNTNGFTLGADSLGATNSSGNTFASWTFRKQPKFFDIQTWTGSGANRTIAHNLGSVPGCIMVKRTSAGANWQVYHRSLANTEYLVLNREFAKATGATRWNSTTPTSTEFSLGTEASVNASGQSFVAYIFAHDAGGFGLTGTDNVISCGSYTGNAGTQSITLGYEPQWIMVKKSSAVGNWHMFDIMRGMPVAAGNNQDLIPNLTDAETGGFRFYPTATGFQLLTETDGEVNASGQTYIYIAIRRGPMKVPTSGTNVFGLSARAGTGANATVTGGQTDDLVVIKNRVSAVLPLWSPRLAGTGYLGSSSNQAEIAAGTTILQENPWDVMDGVKIGTTNGLTNNSSDTYINYLFKRAPSFMDAVCWTGDGVSARVISHNLGVQPEFIAIKRRDGTGNWICNSKLASGDYVRGQGDPNSTATTTNMLGFNSDTGANQTLDLTGYVTSTGIQLNVLSQGGSPNTSTYTYIAYLFATCAGVSKVFSYTGNGSSQTINCGFTGGARWILIKRTNASGDWYVWDTARGIVSGNDQHFSLNSTAAEVTTDDTIDTDSTGFVVNQLSATNVNVSSATYIGLAVA